jgi:hypothetical protein
MQRWGIFLQMRGRLQNNGDIVYPSRGQLPLPLPGYIIDPCNPWRLLPIWPDCNNRGTVIVESSCCGKTTFPMCGITNRIVTIHNCKRCNGETSYDKEKNNE